MLHWIGESLICDALIQFIRFNKKSRLFEYTFLRFTTLWERQNWSLVSFLTTKPYSKEEFSSSQAATRLSTTNLRNRKNLLSNTTFFGFQCCDLRRIRNEIVGLFQSPINILITFHDFTCLYFYAINLIVTVTSQILYIFE